MSTNIPIVYEKEETVLKYKLLTRNLEKEETLTEQELNELGAKGWELCGVLTIASVAHYYFKKFT